MTLMNLNYAQGVDILIGAEYGIQSLKMSSMDEKTMFTVTQYVPHPTLKAVPCYLNGDGPNFKVSHINELV